MKWITNYLLGSVFISWTSASRGFVGNFRPLATSRMNVKMASEMLFACVSGTAASLTGKCPLWARRVLLHAGAFTAGVHTLPRWSWLAAARTTNWSGRVREPCATQTHVLQVWPALAESHQRSHHLPGRPWCQHSYWMPIKEGWCRCCIVKTDLLKKHLCFAIIYREMTQHKYSEHKDYELAGLL